MALSSHGCDEYSSKELTKTRSEKGVNIKRVKPPINNSVGDSKEKMAVLSEIAHKNKKWKDEPSQVTINHGLSEEVAAINLTEPNNVGHIT